MAKPKPETLAKKWLETKAALAIMAKGLVKIEQALIEELGAKEEGAQTHNLEGFKVVITGVINRTLSEDDYLEAVVPELDEDLLNEVVNTATVTKYNLDLAGYRELQKTNPQAFAILAKAVTEKPGKTNVKVSATI